MQTRRIGDGQMDKEIKEFLNFFEFNSIWLPSQLEQHTLRIPAIHLGSRKGWILHFFGFIIYFPTFKFFFFFKESDYVTQFQLDLLDESLFIIFSGYRIVLFCFKRKSWDPYYIIIKNNITFNMFVLLTIMVIIAVVMIIFNYSDYLVLIFIIWQGLFDVR